MRAIRLPHPATDAVLAQRVAQYCVDASGGAPSVPAAWANDGALADTVPTDKQRAGVHHHRSKIRGTLN